MHDFKTRTEHHCYFRLLPAGLCRSAFLSYADYLSAEPARDGGTKLLGRPVDSRIEELTL
jgi:hypothetical protein